MSAQFTDEYASLLERLKKLFAEEDARKAQPAQQTQEEKQDQ